MCGSLYQKIIFGVGSCFMLSVLNESLNEALRTMMVSLQHIYGQTIMYRCTYRTTNDLHVVYINKIVRFILVLLFGGIFFSSPVL